MSAFEDYFNRCTENWDFLTSEHRDQLRSLYLSYTLDNHCLPQDLKFYLLLNLQRIEDDSNLLKRLFVTIITLAAYVEYRGDLPDIINYMKDRWILMVQYVYWFDKGTDVK